MQHHMASAPLDPESPARRLLRALSFPLPPPSRASRASTPTPGSPDSAAADACATAIELHDFRPDQLQQRQSSTQTTQHDDDDDDNNNDEDYYFNYNTRLPWPAQQPLSSPSTSHRHRRSISSCFSDTSSRSTLSESSTAASAATSRATTPAARPKAPRKKSREAESEAIWRELWI